jgi:hypothetical protein
MWSQLFFANLNDALTQLLPSYSNKDLEYLIFQELKSDQYEPYVDAFATKKINYPRIELD